MGDWTMRLTTQLRRGETILFLAFLALTCSAPASAGAQGASQNRAGLVVRFGDGSVLTRCVSFGEPSITGVELLVRSGFPVVIDPSSSIGAGVCKIGPEGCDHGRSCFCQCEGSTCAYWQYFHLDAGRGAWRYSNVGAALYPVTDGAVEGWSWGNNVAPPVVPLDRICAAGGASGATSAPATTRTQEGAPVVAAPQSVTPTARAQEGAPAVVATPQSVTPTVRTQEGAPTDVTTPQPVTPVVRAQEGAPTVMSYVIFAVLVLGLGAWLVARRKAR